MCLSAAVAAAVVVVMMVVVMFVACDVEFARACEQSTDFHFASLEHQFDVIGECLVNARNSRLSSKPAAATDVESDKMSTKSSASSTSDDVCVVLLSFMLYVCVKL